MMEEVNNAIRACVAMGGDVGKLEEKHLKNLPIAFLEIYRPRQVHVLMKKLGRNCDDGYSLCFEHHNVGATCIDGPPQMKKDCYRCNHR